MPKVQRSHIASAFVAGALGLLVVAGLGPAAADDPTGRAVDAGDFYSRTRTDSCVQHLPGFCYMTRLKATCRAGDTVLGGTGWAVNPDGAFVDLAEVDMFDMPYRSRGWQVRNPGAQYFKDWRIRIRVFCADTG